MFYYARSDTHYLLYIYDNLRNELVSQSNRDNPEEDFIGFAVQRSKAQALARYEHLECNPKTGEGARGWKLHVLKFPHNYLSGEQFAIFKALWNWRDETARREDESPSFVLPQQALYDIPKLSPPDARALYSLIPQSGFLAKKELDVIWPLVAEAKKQGAREMDTQQFVLQVRGTGPMAIRPQPAKQVVLEDVDIQRLNRSSLFGDMPLSTKWETDSPLNKADDAIVMFPWQQYVSGAVVSDEALVEAAQEPAAEVSAAVPQDDPPRDDEFVIKRGAKRPPPEESGSEDEDEAEADAEAEASMNDEADASKDYIGMEEEPAEPKKAKKRSRKKRKSGTSAAPPSLGQNISASQQGQGGPSSQANENGEEASDKAEAAQLKEHTGKVPRKSHKARMKAKRRAASGASQTTSGAPSENGEAEQPFDYSKAASVLHAERNAAPQGDAADGKKDKKGKKAKGEAFNPYAKSGVEGVKGARKMPPITGTRSAVFRK